MHNGNELRALHRAGKAHRLPSGAIIPTNTPQDVTAAISQAKAAARFGGDDDDPGFRSHLIGRAAAHGLQRLIPASWGHEQAGKAAGVSRTKWDENRVRRELTGAVRAVAEASRCTIKSAEIEYVTPNERAEALRKAWEYRQTAERLTDRASADSYRQLAKKTLQEAGLA